MLLRPACLPLLLPALLSACIIVPLPEETAKQVPFAIPIRIGGSSHGAPAADLPMPVARCGPPAQTALTAEAVLAEVNRQRAMQGLAALAAAPRLQVVAQDQACQIAESQTIGHRDARGRNIADRATKAGYGWSHIAENVGFGRLASAEAVVAAWMGSAGHRANLLSPKAREAGFGYAENAKGQPGWVLVVGQPR
ncbi:CAP domain-containing protein [Gemmobacter serpentinus]|uniref:CAP domain-containing protein n=1 Tax=Gemmobacter serpentinus TaxID=2652247 RepID=UPI001865791B|nr:CAP domain-containing protein [Gemmobacter serpentinus]